MLSKNKCLADMAVHAYRIESITVISWLYILLERKRIKIVQDISGNTTNNRDDGPVFMSIVLEFPSYDTWLQFEAMTRDQPIEWNNVASDKEYDKPCLRQS